MSGDIYEALMAGIIIFAIGLGVGCMACRCTYTVGGKIYKGKI